MESFFICKKLNAIPVLVGTDRCDKDSRELFFNNLNKASLILKDFFEKSILKVSYAKN